MDPPYGPPDLQINIVPDCSRRGTRRLDWEMLGRDEEIKADEFQAMLIVAEERRSCWDQGIAVRYDRRSELVPL